MGGQGQAEGQRSRFRRFLKFLLDLWFLWALGVFVLLAKLFPNVGRDGGAVRAEYSVSYGGVALIFLVSGMSISTKKLWQKLTDWRMLLASLTLQFLITPCTVLAIVEVIRASKTSKIDDAILAGMVIMGVTPTTVSSNIVMTRNAGGDEPSALMMVTTGNLLGTFITPALQQLFLRPSTGLEAFHPAGSSREIYKRVIMHLGLSLFVPLFVGQVIQNLFPEQTKWVLNKFYLNKVGSFMLVLLVWSTFCNAFYEHAFRSTTPESIIFVCFTNLGLYALFTVLSFYIPRIPLLFEFSNEEIVALCFCCAAKTVALGIPLIQSTYGAQSAYIRGILSVPLVLYQSEQIAVAQVFVLVFKRWLARSQPQPSKSHCGLGNRPDHENTNDTSQSVSA